MIKLDERYAIKSDGTQYILGVPYETKDGQINFSEPKYLPTMEMAITTYIGIKQKELVMQGGDMSIRECIEKFKEINMEIHELLKGVHESEKY